MGAAARPAPTTDVSAELKGNLPANLQPLAGPLAGISQGFADTAAQKLLARPRVQDTFVALASASQSQVVKVLHGDTEALSTSNGNVVLDLRPLVLKLGDRFGFVENLAAKVPQDSAQVTILKSEDLDTAPLRTRRPTSHDVERARRERQIEAPIPGSEVIDNGRTRRTASEIPRERAHGHLRPTVRVPLQFVRFARLVDSVSEPP